jgi:hypothetical protein
MATKTITLHLGPQTHKAQILSRDVEGFNIPGRQVTVDSHRAGMRVGKRTQIHVPGHKEVCGYDRMVGGNQYHYVRAARYVIDPIEVHQDGVYQIIRAVVIGDARV